MALNNTVQSSTNVVQTQPQFSAGSKVQLYINPTTGNIVKNKKPGCLPISEDAKVYMLNGKASLTKTEGSTEITAEQAQAIYKKNQTFKAELKEAKKSENTTEIQKQMIHMAKTGAINITESITNEVLGKTTTKPGANSPKTIDIQTKKEIEAKATSIEELKARLEKEDNALSKANIDRATLGFENPLDIQNETNTVTLTVRKDALNGSLNPTERRRLSLAKTQIQRLTDIIKDSDTKDYAKATEMLMTESRLLIGSGVSRSMKKMLRAVTGKKGTVNILQSQVDLVKFRKEMIDAKQKQFGNKKEAVKDLMTEYAFVVDTIIAGFWQDIATKAQSYTTQSASNLTVASTTPQ